VQNQTYGFDELGNVTARGWWDGTAQRSETFGYDTLNRLTTVTGPANKTYAYATNGNITSKTSVGTYTYPTNGIRPHAVSSIAGTINTSFTYDANGNMLTGNGRTLTYTTFNKVKTAVKGSITDTFTYDAGFNRLIKSNGSGTTIYIGKLYERVTSGSTTTQKHYIYAGPNQVGVYSKVNTTTSMRYFHTDHLGSVDTITNETGGVVQRLSYDAWGKRRNANGTDATSITALTTRGFTRHEHDDEVGLVNMNAREFDPLLGRFITPDTIIQFPYSSQGMNRYTYVNNNPLSFTDPSGHSLRKKLKRAVQKVARSIENKVRADLKFMFRPSIRNAFNAVQAQPGMHYVDKALVKYNWARQGLMAASAFCGPAAAYCAAGASSYTTMLMGGSPSDALRAGAKSYFVSDIMSTNATGANAPWYEKALVYGTQSGIASEIQEGSFKDGFRHGFAYSTSQSWTDYLARKTGLTETDPHSGKLRTDGTRDTVDGTTSRSIFGKATMGAEGSGNHWYENIAPIRAFIVDVSKVHDTMNSWMYSWTGISTGYFVPTGNVFWDSMADVYSAAGMIPAAQFVGKSPQYNPVY
jgi:RHS repeat-associated protein